MSDTDDEPVDHAEWQKALYTATVEVMTRDPMKGIVDRIVETGSGEVDMTDVSPGIIERAMEIYNQRQSAKAAG